MKMKNEKLVKEEMAVNTQMKNTIQHCCQILLVGLCLFPNITNAAPSSSGSTASPKSVGSTVGITGISKGTNPCLNSDGDSWCNTADNCPFVYQTSQVDSDRDGKGNACDNCPQSANASQADTDTDGIGDLCDDGDQDGVLDVMDNCPRAHNRPQADRDGDGIGDVCDATHPAILSAGHQATGSAVATSATTLSIKILASEEVAHVARVQLDFRESANVDPATSSVSWGAPESAWTICDATITDNCYEQASDATVYNALYHPTENGPAGNSVINLPANTEIEIARVTLQPAAIGPMEFDICGRPSKGKDQDSGIRLLAGGSNITEFSVENGNLAVWATLPDGTVLQSCSGADTVNNIDFTATPRVVVDARAPQVSQNGGWGTFDVTFEHPVTCANDFAFSLAVDDAQPGIASPGFDTNTPCTVVNEKVLRVKFDSTQFPTKQWVTMTHLISNDTVRFGVHPCDINQDGDFDLARDWPAWLSAKSGQVASVSYQVDMDGNGVVNHQDLVTLKAMINGTIDGTADDSNTPMSCVHNTRLPNF